MSASSPWLTDLALRLAWAPPWAVSLGLIVVAVLVALAAHFVLVRVVRRSLAGNAFWSALAVRTRRPTRMAFIVAALSLAASVAPLTTAQAANAKHVLLILFIVLVGWIVLTALDIGAALYLRQFKVDVEDNLLARKHLTQVKILRRACAVVVGLVTVGLALMTIPGVRQWGVSLLAAGGAASLIVGLALQPLLTNLIAGIQIAITQPIRIDDAVIVEKEWGNIEEINATLCGRAAVGLAADGAAAQLLHPDAVPELDPRERRPDRHGHALCRPCRPDRPPARQTGRDRQGLAPVGRQGGQPAGHRRHRPGAGGALPGQRPQRAQDLRPALRGPREDDGLPARRDSRSPAPATAGAVGDRAGYGVISGGGRMRR
jgi:hypothetical protein